MYAVMPSALRAETSAFAALFTDSVAAGWTHTCTPATPPNSIEACVIGTYFHPANGDAIIPAIRSAILKGSGKSQYVTTSNSCPANGLIFVAIDCACLSLNERSANRSFNLAASLSAVSARCRASAICDSALSAELRAFDAAACALTASASACANSRCAARAFANASLASARASSAMPLTESASSCAVLADLAASPASSVAALSLASPHSWMLASRSFTLTSEYRSPPTPTTMRIQPTNASTFAAWILRSRGVSIRYLKYGIHSRAISFSSYRSSGNSNTRPTNTAVVNLASRPNHRSLGPTKSCVAHWASFSTRSGGSINPYTESDERRMRIMQKLDISLWILGLASLTILIGDVIIGAIRGLYKLLTAIL